MSLRRSTWGLDRAEHWSTRGVCRDMDPDLFVRPVGRPEAGLSEENEKAAWACHRCPVQPACLRDILRRRPIERPRSAVEGGWVWSATGEGRPAFPELARDAA